MRVARIRIGRFRGYRHAALVVPENMVLAGEPQAGRTDIVEALRCERVLTLPNDYATVSECQNAGIPLELQAPRAGITRGLRQLGQQLVGEQRRDPGLFKRTIGRLFGG